MLNRILLVLIFSILVLCPQIALGDEIIVEGADAVWDLTLDDATEAPTVLGNEAIAEEAITAYNLTVDSATSNAPIMPGDEIIVVDADTVWNLTLDNATHIGRLVGEPGVMVTKYADTFTYYLLENATDVGRLVGEPGVMVTLYADTQTYYLLENATEIGRLVGEPGVMVTKYADTFSSYSLENATEVHRLIGEPGVMITLYADTFSYLDLMSPPFDFTKPLISDVTVTNITLTSATVNWVTDEPADSLVKYGTESGNYTLQKYDSANVTSHSVNLVGLLPNTTYYFVVNSTDLNRNSNESVEYNFTTHIGEDKTPPYTSGHEPAKGAVNVPVDTNITVHVLDAESGVNLSTIVMTVEGVVVTPVITGTPADYTVTYDPPVNFDFGQVVDVTVDASDIAGNTMPQDAYSFTTTTVGPQYFDTGKGTHPSIMGTHKGAIIPLDNITVTEMYTYPCPGTGGHTKSIKLEENGRLIASGTWNGYQSDWHNITLHNVSGATYVKLLKGHRYNYTIVTGSYPQIIHAPSKDVTGGTITCDKFVDANGRIYYDWIPAIKLWAS